MRGFATGIEHLMAEMQLLDLYLQRQVMRLRAEHMFHEDEMRGLYITDEQIDALLALQGALAEGEPDQITDLTAAITKLRREIDARVKASPALPLARLAARFELTPFECQVLILSVVPELDPRYETLYAYAQNDVTKRHPGVDLALRLLCQGFPAYVEHLAVFAADAPLLRHQLLTLLDPTQERASTLPTRYLKGEQRLVDFLLERNGVDQRLAPCARRITPAIEMSELALPAALSATVGRITR